MFAGIFSLMDLARYTEISETRDIDVLRRRLVGFAADLGFPLVNIVLVHDWPGRESEFVSIGNTPQEFLEQSVDLADSKRDPVNQRLKRLSLPFVYDQQLYVDHGAGDLWERQAQYGYSSGVCVALHLPDNKHVLMGVDRPDRLPQNAQELCRLMADVQFLAVHAQAAVEAVLKPPVLLNVPTLTTREKDCLRWTMEGKSAWAVGAILRISESTVRFHLANIYNKLGCSTKQQAIALALRYRLLTDNLAD